MTKLDAYRYLSAQDRKTAFLANVIFTGHTNAAKRLKGAAALVQAGHQLCCAPYRIDVLWVDGYMQPWTYLENAARRTA